jgi:hypothetical protein
MADAKCAICGHSLTNVIVSQLNCGGLPPSHSKVFAMTCPKCHAVLGTTMIVEPQSPNPGRR